MSTAFIKESSQEGWVKIITPYNQAFIDELKETIPSTYRRWDPEEKVWLVHEAYQETLLDILSNYFDDVQSDLVEAEESISSGPYGTLFLLPDAPNALCKSAYRLLSMAYHPDRGGSEESMKNLNLAWEKIRKERGL